MRPRDKSVADRLLLSAQKHIARYGLEKFDTQTIAKSAGTSTSQIYKYYRDRDDLIVEVFSRGWDLLDSNIHDKLRYADEDRPSDTIKEIVAVVFETFEENTNVIASTVVLGQTVGSPLRDKLRRSQGFRRQEKLVLQFAETCRANLPKERVGVVAQVIFGTLHRLLFCLTPYKNHGWLSKAELEEQRQIMEDVLSKVIEGTILKAPLKAKKASAG